MRLFSRIKDYHTKLEEVLENKVFSGNIKNLLLSMIYKIEVSYKDYKEVKRAVKNKNEFIEEFINTIENYCDNIKIVEPEKEEAKILKENKVIALTNTKERSILCYPTENALLYAISDIIPKYFYISESFILKDRFQKVLVNGFNLNNYEILSNFNGWSWDITQNENMKYVDNLIYQNLLFIVGDKFLTEWRNNVTDDRDFLQEMKNYIKNVTGNNSYFYSLCSLLYKTCDENKKRKIKLLIKKQVQTNEKINKSEVELYKRILNDKKAIEESIIELQKEFLIFLNRKANDLETREQIINMIYELRYIKNILIEKSCVMSSIEELNNGIDRILKKVITQACKLGILKIISMDIALNFEIIKYALDTKMINLEQIRLCFERTDSKGSKGSEGSEDSKGNNGNIENKDSKNSYLIIKVLDKEVYEKQGKRKIDLQKDKIEVKYNKNIKLFN